jgi:hypothetical protein
VAEYGDVEYKYLPLDVPLQSSLAGEVYVTIPQTLISRQTLLYIGLSDSKATELWHRWNDWLADGPSPVIDGPGLGINSDDDEPLEAVFLDFVISLIKREPNVDDESDDVQWRSYLDACGTSHDVQDAIMDPHFADIRLSNSSWYWIQDTIEMRYAGLQDIQRISLARKSSSGKRPRNLVQPMEGARETREARTLRHRFILATNARGTGPGRGFGRCLGLCKSNRGA